jgi:hypothetical protein
MIDENYASYSGGSLDLTTFIHWKPILTGTLHKYNYFTHIVINFRRQFIRPKGELKARKAIQTCERNWKPMSVIRLEVLSAVKLLIVLLWVMAPCSLIGG